MIDSMPAKPWWESATIWGGVISAASPLIAVAGYQVDAQSAGEALAAVCSAAGGAVAVWGRLRAARPIRSLRPGG